MAGKPMTVDQPVYRGCIERANGSIEYFGAWVRMATVKGELTRRRNSSNGRQYPNRPPKPIEPHGIIRAVVQEKMDQWVDVPGTEWLNPYWP